MAKGRSAGAGTTRRTPSNHKNADTGIVGVVSCGGGSMAYLFAPKGGATLHLPTGSAAFDAAIVAFVEAGYGAKYRSEIEALAAGSPRSAWPDVAKRLTESGIWGGEAEAA